MNVCSPTWARDASNFDNAIAGFWIDISLRLGVFGDDVGEVPV